MANFLRRLLPQGEQFITMFIGLADHIQETSAVFVEMIEHYDGSDAQARRIKDLEHIGDNLTHDVIRKLNQTFITPFDREDIHLLSTRMDDVLDLIDAAATRLVTYRIRSVRNGVADISRILKQSTAEISQAVRALGSRDHILEHCIEIKRLENEGDRLCRLLIGELFDEEKDPVQIIKWKEIIEGIETAVDKCEDIANILETVTLKNA